MAGLKAKSFPAETMLEPVPALARRHLRLSLTIAELHAETDLVRFHSGFQSDETETNRPIRTAWRRKELNGTPALGFLGAERSLFKSSR
jgi:hypothetical protein